MANRLASPTEPCDPPVVRRGFPIMLGLVWLLVLAIIAVLALLAWITMR